MTVTFGNRDLKNKAVILDKQVTTMTDILIIGAGDKSKGIMAAISAIPATCVSQTCRPILAEINDPVFGLTFADLVAKKCFFLTNPPIFDEYFPPAKLPRKLKKKMFGTRRSRRVW